MRSSYLARVVIAGLSVSVVITLGCGITEPTPTPSPITVEFGGRVVNAEAGGPVANVRVSVSSWSSPDNGNAYILKETATSGGDGSFTLPVTLPRNWTAAFLKFTGPAGYDDTSGGFRPTAPCSIQLGYSPCWAAADRPAIRMYPALVIRPGESIEVRVDDTAIVLCGHPLGDVEPVTCRRVLVSASPGGPVELEVLSHDSSKPMALGLATPDWNVLEPHMSVRRLMVPPGGVAYVLGAGTATLTARR